MDKQKILIVDDSEMNRALLIDILEEHYDVVEAENGVEAISLLSKQRADFSLLLLDIMMPEMDGFEVLAYINKYHWNDTFAVIMISSSYTCCFLFWFSHFSISLLSIYYFFFLRDTVFLGPFLVLALVLVFCPLRGNPLACLIPL